MFSRREEYCLADANNIGIVIQNALKHQSLRLDIIISLHTGVWAKMFPIAYHENFWHHPTNSELYKVRYMIIQCLLVSFIGSSIKVLKKGITSFELATALQVRLKHLTHDVRSPNILINLYITVLYKYVSPNMFFH